MQRTKKTKPPPSAQQNSMQPLEIRRILLGEKCYFHRSIPPVFSSKIFAERSDNFPNSWLKEPPPTMSEQYKYAQHGGRRRDMRIPAPINQFCVAHVIAEHWQDIRQHMKNSGISASRCRISTKDGVQITRHKKLRAKRLMAIASHSHILKTDISRYFPSIYTHSIPWAIHGKELAKEKSQDMGLWGNILDKALRQCNRKQTSGIPIGPGTSDIVAEIIMSAIDVQVQKELGKKSIAGYRHVDDYFLCFDSEKEAESALAAIEKVAAEYELDINPKKTQIIKSAEFAENSWAGKLNAISAYKKKAKVSNWLTQFASEAFTLAHQNPQDSVMKYALKILRSVPLPKDGYRLRSFDWDLYESILIRIMTAYPYATDSVAKILLRCKRKHYPLNIKKLSGAVSALIGRHAPLEHHSEVAWALWLTKVVGLKIEDKAAELLPKVNSGICALLTLDNINNDRITKKIDQSPWREHLSADREHCRCWLLAYEGARMGVLDGKWKDAEKDDFFSVLRKNEVSFYKGGNDITKDDDDDDDDDFDDSLYP